MLPAGRAGPRTASTRRAAAPAGALPDNAHNGAKSKLKVTTSFLRFLAACGRAIGFLPTSDLDAWGATGPPSRCQAARPFLTWATRQRVAPSGLDYAPRIDNGHPNVVFGDGRWGRDHHRHRCGDAPRRHPIRLPAPMDNHVKSTATTTAAKLAGTSTGSSPATIPAAICTPTCSAPPPGPRDLHLTARTAALAHLASRDSRRPARHRRQDRHHIGRRRCLLRSPPLGEGKPTDDKMSSNSLLAQRARTLAPTPRHR